MSVTTLRVHNTIQRNFFIAPNSIARDSTIPPRAKAVYIYLISNVDGWKITVHSLGKVLNMAKNTVASALKDLEKAGYIRRTQLRKETGIFAGWEYVVFDEKQEVTGDIPAGEAPYLKNCDTTTTDSDATAAQKLSNGTDQAKRPKAAGQDRSAKNAIPFFGGHKKTISKEDHNYQEDSSAFADGTVGVVEDSPVVEAEAVEAEIVDAEIVEPDVIPEPVTTPAGELALIDVPAVPEVRQAPSRPSRKKRKTAQRVEYPVEFEAFWKAHPALKERKPDAYESWLELVYDKTDPVAPATLVEGAQKFAQYHTLKGTDRQFIPRPFTWLNNRGWEDDLADNFTNVAMGRSALDAAYNATMSAQPAPPTFAHEPAPQYPPAGELPAGGYGSFEIPVIPQ